MNIHHIAKALGGQVTGHNSVLCRGPEHSAHDRSLSVLFHQDGSFVVNSHAGDSWQVCRDYVRARLGLPEAEWVFPQSAQSRNQHRPATDRGKLEWLISKLTPIEGTAAEAYLRSRGLDLPSDGHHLRFLPMNSPKFPWPCMAAIVTDFADASRFMSLHLTRLRPDGQGKAPLPKGEQRSFLAGFPIKGGVIRLCDDADVTLRLGLAEGIETALSVMTSYRRDEGRLEPVWSALDAGNLGNLRVVSGIETLAIYADRGQAGERAADLLADRWLAGDREVFTFTAPADDWNPTAAA